MNSLRLTVWGLRLLFIIFLFALCMVDKSGTPALAFGLSWSTNGLFLAAYVKGVLRLPKFLERVHPIEPVLYRILGVDLVKWIVANRLWPLVAGSTPAPKAPNRQEFLNQTEESTRCAEVCHGGTFVLASLIALICAVVGQTSPTFWIMVFNVALNGYPILLQRFNRHRIQRIRTSFGLLKKP